MRNDLILSWAPAALSLRSVPRSCILEKNRAAESVRYVFVHQRISPEKCWVFYYLLFNSRGYIESQRCKVSQMIGPLMRISSSNPSVTHKLERCCGVTPVMWQRVTYIRKPLWLQTGVTSLFLLKWSNGLKSPEMLLLRFTLGAV